MSQVGGGEKKWAEVRKGAPPAGMSAGHRSPRRKRLERVARAVRCSLCAGAWLACAASLKAQDSTIAGISPIGLEDRSGATEKGSLVAFPHVEIKWDAQGRLRQDSFLTLTNDFPEDVQVQLYVVNGDAPTLPLFAGNPPVLIERAHPGWNWVDVQLTLTGHEPTYWSAFTGMPKGVSSLMLLEPGLPPGRPDPDPDNLGGRVVRGFVLAWAVDANGKEIRWNHLSGSTLIVDYTVSAAWEYNAWTFQAHSGEQGQEPESCLALNLDTGRCVARQAVPGRLDLDGQEYDACPERLQFQFIAQGASYFTPPDQLGITVGVDTYLSLMVLGLDLRQDNIGPITTKAKFDIWNQNEIRFSGTERCVRCWDSTILRNYTLLGIPNHFLSSVIQTRSGHARVDGLGSSVCDSVGVISRDAPLLGVIHKSLRFPTPAVQNGPAGSRAKSGVTLGGQGEQSARILYDIIAPPEELNTGGGER